jgi:hypothetical protein
MSFINKHEGQARRQFLHIDDLDSLTTAAILCGSGSAALKSWLAVTHRVRVSSKTTVALTSALCRQFGILSRKAKESGLRHWEALGVFKVVRKNGKNPNVTVLGKLGPLRRKATLTRTKIETLGGEFGNIASFSEGPDYAARTITATDRRRLEQAFLSGESVDLQLIDFGAGWLVQNIFRASETKREPEVESLQGEYINT